MMDDDPRATQTTGDALAVLPEKNEVAIHLHDASEFFRTIPLQRKLVTECTSLKEFLTLENHWDARAGK